MKQRFFGSEKNDFLATYKLNDHADFLYNHNESASRWAYTYTGITHPDYEDMNDHPRYIRRYENDKDFLESISMAWTASAATSSTITTH